MTRRATLAACAILAATTPAQDWRLEPIHGAGIRIEAPSRLERLPMQLGEEALYHRARLRPKDDADFVRAEYYWYCDVYSFSKKERTADDIELPPDIPEELKQQLKELLARSGFHQLKSFKAWLDDQKGVTIQTAGKAQKGKAGKLDYAHWVWTIDNNFGPVDVCYCEAAVYAFEDREVALVVEMPLETLKPAVPKTKWKSLIDRIIRSGAKLDEAAEDDSDAKRDRFADTPEKQKALAAAKQNIQGLNGWDYFTQPNYIVIYSWDFEKPDERQKSKKDAIYYGSRLEKMRELYLASYPLDATGTKAVMPDPSSLPNAGPVTGEQRKPPGEDAPAAPSDKPAAEPLGEVRYSVFRLCATYEQFQKYGQSPPGVVGWFSPASKELVVFLGGDTMMGSGATEAVTYHEGWHQYADFYFDHPLTPKRDQLHRWFDEGHGDYFGSFRMVGSSWKYLGSKMRYEDCKQMVRAGDYVPFKQIVTWDVRRFYSEKAPYYYAQAFSMIDFLRRAQKSRDFAARWGEILDMYRKVMLVTGDSEGAVAAAFLKFEDADWQALEAAWKAWVASGSFLNGR